MSTASTWELNYHMGMPVCIGDRVMISYAKNRSEMGRIMALIKIGTIQNLTNLLSKRMTISYDFTSVIFMNLPELNIIRSLYKVAEDNYKRIMGGLVPYYIVQTNITMFRNVQKKILDLVLPNFPLECKYRPKYIKIERCIYK